MIIVKRPSGRFFCFVVTLRNPFATSKNVSNLRGGFIVKNKKVYLAGDMLTKGSQLLREKEAQDVRAVGFEMYNPMENKEINDKANAVKEGLAERIVEQDSDAIYNSDILIIEPQPFAMGTMVELGQVKGRKDLAKGIKHLIDDTIKNSGIDGNPHDPTNYYELIELVDRIQEWVGEVVEQKVYPHYEDIRRFNGVTESEDRRSLGINQYVYGVCLDLTDGKGFYEWDEILEELKREKNG